MKNYCIDTKNSIYINIAKAVTQNENPNVFTINKIGYLLNDFLNEKGMSLDNFWVNFDNNADDFRSFLDNVQKRNIKKMRAVGPEYLANVFTFSIHNIFNSKTDDAVWDLTSKIIEIIDRAVIKNRENGKIVTFEYILKNKLSSVIEEAYVRFNSERCKLSNELEEKSNDLGETIIPQKGVSLTEEEVEKLRNRKWNVKDAENTLAKVKWLDNMLELDNWSSLAMMAKDKLSKMFDIRISSNNKAEDLETDIDLQLNDLGYAEEEKPKDGFGTAKEMISQYKTASKVVKKYLSLIPAKGETLLGTKRLYKPRYYYNKLIDLCRGIKSSDEMLERFKKFAEQDNTFNNYVYSKIDPEQAINDADRIMRIKLMTDFFISLANVNKSFYEYRTVVDKKEGKKIVLVKLDKLYESQTYEEFRNKIDADRNGSHILTKDKTLAIKKDIIDILGEEEYIIYYKNLHTNQMDEIGKNVPFDSETYPNKIKRIMKLLDDIGLTNDKNRDKINDSVHDIVYNRNQSDLRKFKRFISKFIQSTDIEYNGENINAKDLIKKYNPNNKIFYFDNEKGIKFQFKHDSYIDKNLDDTIKNICSLIDEYSPEQRFARTAEIKNREGKTVTVYCDQQKSFMTQIEQEINGIANESKDVDGERIDLSMSEKKEKMDDWLYDNYLASSFFVDNDGTILNKWLEDLSSDFSKFRSIEKTFAYNFKIRINEGFNGKHVENYSEKERLLQMLSDFAIDEEDNSDYCYYPVFTLGDSESNQSIRAKKYSIDEVKKALFNVYKQECRRDEIIKRMRDHGIPVPSELAKNEGKYVFLKFLNGKVNKGYDSLVVNAIDNALDDLVVKFKNKLARYSFGNEISSLATRNNKEKLTEDEIKYLTDDFIQKFIANYALAQICQMQLFNIDSAFFENTKLMQKRNKAIYASGTTVDLTAKDWTTGENLWDEKNPVQRALYFNEIRLNAEDTNPEFMKSIIYQFANDKEAAIELLKDDNWKNRKNDIKNLLGNDIYNNVYSPYLNNKVTDGQGYRTLYSYRKIAISTKKWSDEHEEAYNYIKNVESRIKNEIKEENKKPTTEELKRISEYSALFQPFKPHGKFHEKIELKDENDKDNIEDTLFIPCEHKYAEIVLIPCLLNDGSILKKLANYMQDKGIDMSCSDACVKFGAFGMAKFQHINKQTGEIRNIIKDQESFNEIMEKQDVRVHELDMSGFKMQTNVTDHGNVDNLFGTQSRKLILNGISKNNKYSLLKDLGFDSLKISSNKEVLSDNFTGKNMFSFYNSLVAANQLESFNEYKKRLYSIDENGKEYLDHEKVSRLLIENGNNNERTKQEQLFAFFSLDNDTISNIVGYYVQSVYDDDFVIPFNEGSIEHEAFSLIASIFKNTVNKQKILGGSLVQASAFGFSGIETDYSGELKATVVDNNVIEVECEIPFNFTVTDHTGRRIKLDFNTFCNPDGTFKKFANSNETLIEKEHPGILNMIAYRIPTEREYSMLNLKVVRCTPEVEGGIIKVPQQYTTVSGFDFDIDKLYMMKKEFKMLKPEWEKAYKDKNRWFEAKKEILEHIKETNPDYINEVTTEEIEESFDDEQTRKIWNEIYSENNGLYEYLKGKIGSNKHIRLNELILDDDQTILRFAKSKGFDTAKDYKNYLFANKASELGYTPIITVTDKFRYIQLNEDKILSEGKSPIKFLANAAREIGIELSYNKNENRFEQYDPQKVVTENTRVSRNNMLLNIIQDRLRSPETFKSRYYPGGFAEMKYVAGYMRYLQIEDISYNDYVNKINNKQIHDVIEDEEIIDPLTYIKYENQNAIASKLIGLFANHNTNHSLSLLAERLALPVDKGIYFGKIYRPDSQTEMQSFIRKDDNINRRVAELLAASVDAVKDPVLSYLNINLITANAAACMVRLGYDFEDISLLLNQPIIKELCNKIESENIDVDTAISSLTQDIKIGKEEILSTNQLKHSLEDNIDSRNQQIVINLFKQINAVASELNTFVQSTRYTAANAVGSTYGDFLRQNFIEKNAAYKNISIKIAEGFSKPIREYSKNEIEKQYNSNQEYIDDLIDNPFMFEQCAYDCNKKFLQSINPLFGFNDKYYKEYIGSFDDMASTLGKKISAETYENLMRMLPAYFLSNMDNSPFNPKLLIPFDNGNKNGNITAREFFREKFPLLLIRFLSENESLKNKYEILDKITRTVQKDLSGKEHQFLKIDYRAYKDEKYSTDGITQSWAAMLNDEDPRVRELGKFLFYYSFHINGTDMHIYSFMNLAPNILKLRIPVNGNDTYISFFRKLRNGESFGVDENNISKDKFIKEYMLNDIDNPLFTKIIYDKETKKQLIDYCFINGFYQKEFIINDPKILNKLTRTVNDTVTCSPIINVANNYYMSVDNNGNPKYILGKDEPIKYVHIMPSSLSNVLLELNGKESNYSYNFDENFGTYMNDDFTYSEADIIDAIYYLIEAYNDYSNEHIDAEVFIKNESDKSIYDIFLSLVSKVYNLRNSTAPIIEAYSILNKNNSSIKAFNKDNFLEQLDIFGGEMNLESDYLRKSALSFKEEAANNGDVSNIIDTFNRLYNFYKKNNNSFVINIDGELVKLC